jgi:hypothetical protein
MIFVNKAGFPTTLVTWNEVPWTLYFFIGEFEDTDQRHGLSKLYFLWGFMKYVVYASEVRELRHLRERINTSVVVATPKMIQQTWNEIEYRPYVCRATDGTHIGIF